MDDKNWDNVPKVQARSFFGPVYYDGNGFSDVSNLAFALRLIGQPLPQEGVWSAREVFIDFDKNAVLDLLRKNPNAPEGYEPTDKAFIEDFVQFYNDEMAEKFYVPDYRYGIVFGPAQ